MYVHQNQQSLLRLIEYPRISLTAQVWATNNKNSSTNGLYKPNYRNYAQYAWGLYSEDSSVSEFDLDSANLNIWFDFHGKPYKSYPYGLALETDEEWNNTFAYGCGCSATRNKGGSWNFILVIFFNLFNV